MRRKVIDFFLQARLLLAVPVADAQRGRRPQVRPTSRATRKRKAARMRRQVIAFFLQARLLLAVPVADTQRARQTARDEILVRRQVNSGHEVV